MGREDRRRPRREVSFHLVRPEPVRRFSVRADFAGTRLDVFLARRLKWRSRTNVQRLLAEREVRVNGLRRKASYRLHEGDVVEIPLPPPPPEAFHIHEIPLNILYEDDHLVVLNKQPGIVVHPTGRKRYNTLINALHLRYRRPDDPEHDIVPRLAHRLDKDTSGVLVVCKTSVAHRDLYFQFERGQVEKEYLAIVEGEPQSDRVHIDLPLGRDLTSEIRLKQAVRLADGEEAMTEVVVSARFGKFSLVVANPHTGKQHQIRVHLAAIGHPIVGDRLYGSIKEVRRSDLAVTVASAGGDEVLISRQALHAQRLRLQHPATGQMVEFFAPLPSDMARLLEVLRAGADGAAVASR